MIANRDQCLERPVLNDLLAGRLPSDRFAEAVEHVESCELCTQTIESATNSNGEGPSFSWIAKAARLPSANEMEGGFDHELECQAVLGNLMLQSRPVENGAERSALPVESLGVYRLLKWLGAGGMGSVYLAEHQRLKRLAAIKLLPREKLIHTGWLERFNREMMSIAALEHPHVVRAIDAGDDAGWHYLVMEYLEGADLSKVSRRMGEIPLRTTCELIRQAALGLSAIHALGMTHRDIKPSNLFLTRGGTVKLLDLGLVLSGDSPLATDERLTTVGHLMGTLPYMAREQLMDASSVDWRADIYSLGATMFRLLTGRAPYGPASNLAQTIQAISSAPCPSLKAIKSDVPSEVAELVDRMLSHDPGKRPQSADEVSKLLEPFCDEAAPQSLIRAALNAPDDHDELQNSQLQAHSKLLAAEAGGSGRSKSRWTTWIAAALLPLAFLAGIVITVTTDKGTLVIESDEPSVAVNVTQGDKVIESLRVEQGTKTVRLQSGKYRIEIVGVDNDGLEISDKAVLLTRGDKQVVTIKRQATNPQTQPAGAPAEPAGSLYQGQTFAHWMSVLERDKDIAVMAHAMHAVKLLAETDAARTDAARKCLLPARQLGGFIMTGRPKEGRGTDNPSGWFMTELADNFATFFPEPGFSVIIDEMEVGNERSVQACQVLLGTFEHGTSNYGAQNNYMLVDYLSELSRSAEGRTKLQRLGDAIAKRIGSMNLGHLSRGNLFRKHLLILDVMGANLAEQQQVVDWAKQLAAAGNEVIEKKQSHETGENGGMSGPDPRGVNLGRSPLDAWTALMISRTLDGFPGVSVAAGLLEPPLDASQQVQDRATEALARLAKQYPQETAEAIIAHLERLAKPTPGWGGLLKRAVGDARTEIAKSLLVDANVDSVAVAHLLAYALKTSDPACIFDQATIEDLLRHFGLRLARESYNDEDPQREKKDQLALYIFASIGPPAIVKDRVKQYEQVAFDLVVGRTRPDFTLQTGNVVALAPWPELIVNWSWKPAYTRSAFRTLLVRHPENLISAFATSLRRTPFAASRTVLISPLLQAVANRGDSNTPLALPPKTSYLAAEETHVNAMNTFLESESSQAVIAELNRAYQQAFEKCYSELEFRDLQSLLLTRLVLASYLRQDITQEKTVIESLKKLVQVEQKRGEPSKVLSADLLLLAADKLDHAEIPFSTLQAASSLIALSDKCEEIRRLVNGMHASRPDEFCEFFTADLERFSMFLNDAKARGQKGVDQSAMKLYGGLDAACQDWYHSLVRLLQANEKTKQRANKALTSIIEHLPSNPELLQSMRRLVSQSE